LNLPGSSDKYYGVIAPFFVEQNLRFRTSFVGLSWKLTKIRCRPVELEAHKKLKSFLLFHLHSIIMATIFISKALPITTAEDVQSKFLELELGVIEAIDMKEYDRDGTTFRKFWIHYSAYSTEAHAVGLMDRLKRNEERQKNGEVIPAGDIPRIVYGVNRRTGNDMYWQVFSAKTKAEREAERAAKEVAVAAEKPKARIVM
jgi:hypothetical protein